MGKEYLEAFEVITGDNYHCDEETFYHNKAIVEQALQRLESIDNAKPSEALECLERIDNTLCLNNIKGKLDFGIDTEEHTDCDSVIGMTEDLETIKQALLKAQGQKKVLNEVLKLNSERAEKFDYYQDLEKQLGCPLDVIEKAIKNGIYTNVYSGICYVTRSDDYLLVSDDYDVKLSDYKKTWWLKEDRSE